jgi:hypothetical protein
MINATLKLTRTADDGAEMFRKYFLVADFADVGQARPASSRRSGPMPDAGHLTVKGGEKTKP